MRDESKESQREEGTAKAWLPMRTSLVLGAHSYNCFRFPDLPERGMKKRGKVLRDPRAGPGLLMIEGRQYRFCLDGVWKSEIPPKPGLTVDVKLDQAGRILAITSVSDSHLAEDKREGCAKRAK